MLIIGLIKILHAKILKIEQNINNPSSPEYFLFERDIIETAFWARLVFEILEKFSLEKYGYSFKTNILVKSFSGPDYFGSGKPLFYEEEKSIKDLLGAIIHFRFFHLNKHANGDHRLDVQSDLKSRCDFRFADFLQSLKTFLIPKDLLILGVCDMLEEEKDNFVRDWRVIIEKRVDRHPFMTNQSIWLLTDSFRENVPLKLEIMENIFGISNIPETVSSELGFFPSVELSSDGKIVIGFFPGWEKNQNTFSDPFDHHFLFDLIRKHYEKKWHSNAT